MDPQVLQWLEANTNKVFESPRKFFGRGAQSFKIVKLDKKSKCVRVAFGSGVTLGLPLYFWMFDRVINYIRKSPETVFPIGARIQPPYPKDSIEGEIWKEPRLYSSPYKSAPHILDILAYVGMVEFKPTRNRETNRRVQGARYYEGTKPLYPIKEIRRKNQNKSTTLEKQVPSKKEEFISKYRETIEKWVDENKAKIIEKRLQYSWRSKDRFQCEKERNQVAKAITQSRIRNQGALDLATLDEVTRWGFNRKFPCRNPEKALEITGKTFEYLDKEEIRLATLKLLEIKHVGISRASKIIGLSDQENLCIYDSRVGAALRTLTYDGTPIIPTPPSRVREHDTDISKNEWANHYEHLIWTIEVMRDYLNNIGCTYRLADVEMALYMIGK